MSELRVELSAQNYRDVRRPRQWLLGQAVFVEGRLSAGDGGEGWFQVLTGSGLDDDDGFILRSGGFALKRISVDWLNPRWWGARGDGVTDDTLAFKRCIEVSQASAIKIVGVPNGVFRFSTMELRSGITLEGKGGLLKLLDGVCVDPQKKYYLIHNLGSESVKYVNLRIDGNARNNRDYRVADLITAAHSSVVVEGCYIESAPDSAIMVAEARQGRVSNNRITGARDIGIYINSLNRGVVDGLGLMVSGNSIDGCVYGAIGIKRASSELIVGHNSVSNCGNGITVEEFGVEGGVPAKLTITGNILSNIGVQFADAPNLARVGISLDATKFALITGNQIHKCAGVGLRLSGVSGCVIEANVFSHDGFRSRKEVSRIGIAVAGRRGYSSSDLSISRNMFSGFGGLELKISEDSARVVADRNFFIG